MNKQFASRVVSMASLLGYVVATLADGIIGFERITEQIDPDVAVGRGLYVAMLLQLQPNR